MQGELQGTKQETVWVEYEKFKKDYELSLKTNREFPVIIKEIMDRENLTIDSLQEKSKLDRRTICRLRSGKIKSRIREMEYFPSMKTIVAFCIACNLDMLNAITLLESLGLTFKRTSKVHYAYCYLIVNCRGKAITECNTVLKNFGIAVEDLLRDPDDTLNNHIA